MQERRVRIAGLDTRAVGSFEHPERVVVVLHGFAMQGSDLQPFARSLGLPGLFLFPDGPVSAELEPGVERARAWWRIDPVLRAASLARGARDLAEEHPAGLASAREQLVAFLAALPELVRGFERCPLVLTGFSQGGMLACDACLRTPIAPSALVLFSTSRIAFDEWLPELARLRARQPPFPPVLISHGDADEDLAFATGERLRDALQEAGASVTWLPFSGGHQIPLVVWRRFRKFLSEAPLAPSGALRRPGAVS